jgi:hypothetical protein
MDLELSRRRLVPGNVGLVLTRLPFQAHSAPAVGTDQRAIDRDSLVDVFRRNTPSLQPVRASGFPTPACPADPSSCRARRDRPAACPNGAPLRAPPAISRSRCPDAHSRAPDARLDRAASAAHAQALRTRPPPRSHLLLQLSSVRRSSR